MRYTTEQIIEKLRQLKVVPVIALDKAEDILPLAKNPFRKRFAGGGNHFPLRSS